MIGGPKKILIAEDERPLARALELKLSSAGFKTRVALDGQEVLDFLKKDKFDLLVLDLVMPNVCGFDVLLKLQQMKSKVPVVITSNLGQGGDLEKVKSFGVIKYFIKSNSSIAEIVDFVSNFLKNKTKDNKK